MTASPRIHVSTMIHGLKVWFSAPHEKGVAHWLEQCLRLVKTKIEKEISYEEFTGLRRDMILASLDMEAE